MKLFDILARSWRRIAALVLLSIVLPAGAAPETESAGVVLALSGQVELEREGQRIPASGKAAFRSGDTFVVGEGQVQVRFADGTLLTLYRNTRFAVDDYRYAKGRGDRAQFSLVNGLMHTLTGQIDKRNYLLKTRLANLGVRGTDYTVRLEENLHVNVNTGQVAVSNPAGTLLVKAGGSAVVTRANAMPQPGGGKIAIEGGARGPGGAPGQVGAGPGAPPPPPPPPGTQNFSGQHSTPQDPPPFPPPPNLNPPPPPNVQPKAAP